MGPFHRLYATLRGANVGCLGAVVLVLLVAGSIFGLVLMAWWPYFQPDAPQ